MRLISFGYWVRRRRKALDLTQASLAKLVGCSIVTIKKIERDKRRSSQQIAELLATHLVVKQAQVIFDDHLLAAGVMEQTHARLLLERDTTFEKYDGQAAVALLRESVMRFRRVGDAYDCYGSLAPRRGHYCRRGSGAGA